MSIEKMRQQVEQNEIQEKRARIRREAEELRQLEDDVRNKDFDCEPDENRGVPLDKSQVTK